MNSQSRTHALQGTGLFLALCLRAAAQGTDCNENGIPDAEDLTPALPSFSAPVDFPLSAPDQVFLWVGAVADMDSDGRQDLVAYSWFLQNVIIFSNRPDVNPPGALFEPARTLFNAADDAGNLTAFDLDANGRMDLVLSLGGSLEVRLQVGEGVFSEAFYELDDSSSAWPILAGDLNGDARTDLAVGSYWVTVFFNQGGGRFSPGVRIFTRTATLRVLEDLDGDADLDLAGTTGQYFDFEANQYAGGEVLIAKNRGNGTFEEPVVLFVGGDTGGLAGADFDGDLDIDLAVGRKIGTNNDPAIVVLRNDGHGSFETERTYDGGPDAYSPQAGDFDGDGDFDLVTAWSAEPLVRFWWNRGDGVFDPPETASLSGRITGATVADVDGDGIHDLVTSPLLSNHDVATLIFGRPRGTSLDCDRDGVPDECMAAADGVDCRAYVLPHECVADCDFDGRSDACEVLAEEVPDCDSNGVPDTCEHPGISAADCDENGVFDYCEPEIDCNRDGVGDSCQDLYDGDRNGVPDDCEDRPISFEVTFDAPETVGVSPGESTLVEASVVLEQRGLVPGEDGASGWSLFVKAEGCDVIAATLVGTEAAEYYDDGNGYNRTEVTCHCPGGYNGAITLVVLSLQQWATLPTDEGPPSILRLTLSGSLGEDGGCSSCRLGLVEVDDCNRCHRGQPVTNIVTYREESHAPSYAESEIRFCPVAFRRGDVNADGRVDISDAIRAFMFLFLGASEPPCLDTGDSNDDGAVNITDGLHILNDFFGEGTSISDPGPFECGADPSPDDVSCHSYTSCP